ncbi:reverse transcriptase/maturase family protein [Streptomyces halobius]|uniref:Reverse transcriptase/maturase family protein n=1 Tax=Streptomyces halobius TaxID=2879846 RepID=A0ABY4MNL7_9ACTN|nr:reverse transcriptase/maturase family protein [Streptomyces halobius]
MRHERYRFHPVRRVHIPKKQKGKTRPLGLPTWSDKLVGEVVRLLLEAYDEPVFSGRSHGFRPRKGCHTALRDVAHTWTGATWFIEGDIADCFGSLDHEVMLRILGEKVHDSRFLRRHLPARPTRRPAPRPLPRGPRRGGRDRVRPARLHPPPEPAPALPAAFPSPARLPEHPQPIQGE